jgi:hypothetical protein
MVTIPTSQGPFAVSDRQVHGLVCCARRHADLVATTLRDMFPGQEVSLPRALLLELAAVLQLGMWEHQGLAPYLPAGVPRFAEAAGQLGRRARNGLREFESSSSIPLLLKVLQVWMEHFSWDGVELLGCDAIVGTVDEDEFAVTLADFVWQHRRELSRLLKE